MGLYMANGGNKPTKIKANNMLTAQKQNKVKLTARIKKIN